MPLRPGGKRVTLTFQFTTFSGPKLGTDALMLFFCKSAKKGVAVGNLTKKVGKECEGFEYETEKRDTP